MANENRQGPFTLSQFPELDELLQYVARTTALTLDSHRMATVESYNPNTQRVTVFVDSLAVVEDNSKRPTTANPNPKVTQAPKKLVDIPVAWPRTSGGYQTLPLGPGDRGELHVQDRGIDAYLLAGKPGAPQSFDTHGLADSIFHPTVIHNTDPITPPTDLNATVLHGATQIKLGRLANSPVLRGGDVQSAFTTYTAAINAAQATWAAVVPATSTSNGAFIAALAVATAVLSTTIASWASLKTSTE